MAQIIDFISRKKLIENKDNLLEKKVERAVVNFTIVSQRNLQSKEKLRKEREQSNKNVMKSYRIK